MGCLTYLDSSFINKADEWATRNSYVVFTCVSCKINSRSVSCNENFMRTQLWLKGNITFSFSQHQSGWNSGNCFVDGRRPRGGQWTGSAAGSRCSTSQGEAISVFRESGRFTSTMRVEQQCGNFGFSVAWLICSRFCGIIVKLEAFRRKIACTPDPLNS